MEKEEGEVYERASEGVSHLNQAWQSRQARHQGNEGDDLPLGAWMEQYKEASDKSAPPGNLAIRCCC